jgi:hypothetical protein
MNGTYVLAIIVAVIYIYCITLAIHIVNIAFKEAKLEKKFDSIAKSAENEIYPIFKILMKIALILGISIKILSKLKYIIVNLFTLREISSSLLFMK